MNSVVIGMGEIGKALTNILSKNYSVYTYDAQDKDSFVDFYLRVPKIEVLHVCFPYSERFIGQVREYQKFINPKFTVIHSTVPTKTCEKLKAIHSPVIGIHPHLEQSILTFTKYLGGEQASEAADYFRKAGIKVYITDKSETTELMKLLCTMRLTLDAEYHKMVKRECLARDIPFELLTHWTNNYSDGYTKLGYPEYVRSNLIPVMKKVGGHCCLPNLNLIDNEFSKFLKKLQTEE